MSIRRLVVPAFLAMALPVWAHCGKCGVGDSEKEGKGEATAHSTSVGHSHAHAELGKPAPDFTLTDADGKEHKLFGLRGKVVVLEWTNHKCPFVNRHHDSGLIAKTPAKFEGKNVAWLAIDSTLSCEKDRERISAWAKEHKLPYPVLLDAAGEVGHIYGAKTTPHIFIIDQKGILAYMGAPDDDGDGTKDNPRNYIEEAVTSLLSGSAVATARTKSYGCSVKYKK